MRVLLFTQYFPPEIGATQTRLHAFAAGLTERGHDVEVICEVPNHPQGVVRPGYGGRLVDRRRLDGFLVSYVWVKTTPTKTTRTRLAFYGSYMAMGAVVGSLIRRPDVILASSPPLPVALAGAVVAARHRVPWVMDVRDLWPEAAVAVGELSNPRLLRAAERLERWLYRRAAAITTVTESFRESIAANVSHPEKIYMVPNGTTPLYVRAAELEPDRASLGLPANKFIWTYAGNVGVAQGLETAIAAAAALGDGFQLLIIGNGPMREDLEDKARLVARGSVIFHDQVPPQQVVTYLRASDALLVPLAADPILRKFIPSKLYDFCATGRPVIVLSSGEARAVATQARAALDSPPGDVASLVDAIRCVHRDPHLQTRLADAGADFGKLNLREAFVGDLANILEEIKKNGCALPK